MQGQISLLSLTFSSASQFSTLLLSTNPNMSKEIKQNQGESKYKLLTFCIWMI